MKGTLGVALTVALAISTGIPSVAGAQASAVTGPLAELDALTQATWHAQGSGFDTTLSYRWLLAGRLLEAANEVRNEAGGVIARYRGAYAWDAGRNEIVFWTVAESGEVHRGRAWWRGGVLWHEAEVSGGSIEAYASAVRPADGRLEYFAAYGTRRAGPELLDSEPLVYSRTEVENLSGERFIVLLRLRHDLWERYQETGVWPDDPEANEALEGHVTYWKDLFEQGKVILTGGMGGEYWDNVAQIILDVTDGEEAEALVRGDPAVAKHVFKAQVRPFTVHRVKDP